MMTIGHTLVVGTTMSGKTTWVKRHAKKASDKGIPVLALSAMPEEWDFADFRTSDQGEFVDMVFAHQNCIVIADEAGETIGRSDKNTSRLATRARHYGHQCLFLAQTGRMINPDIRDNCSNLVLFQCGKKTVALLEENFPDPLIYEAPNLNVKQGEHIVIVRGYGARKYRLFDQA